MVAKNQVQNKQQKQAAGNKQVAQKNQQNKVQQKNGKQTAVAQNPKNKPPQKPVEVKKPDIKQQIKNGNNKRPQQDEKKNGKKMKKDESEEDDDEDDDEDEDDEDLDEEDEVDEDDDEDDDDEDDDEDDDDEEDDEDEEEEEKPAPKTKEQPKKQEVKTAKKAEEKPVAKKTEEKPAAKKTEETKTTATPAERPKKEDEDRTLFVKNLPKDITEAKLKELSSDIVEVRLKESKGKVNQKNIKKGRVMRFAYLVFSSVEKAEKAFNELQHKKLGDKEIIVDYCGAKSTYTKKEQPAKEQAPKVKDLKRLHVNGFSKTTKEDEIKKLFSNYVEFNFIKRKDGESLGFAFVSFSSEADAKKALEATNGKDVAGKKINVDYAFEKPKSNEKAVQPAAKKQKDANGNQVAVKKDTTVKKADDKKPAAQASQAKKAQVSDYFKI